ncbi:polysaccharide biosynthesis tyrosine autokinase [Saccharopolyspora hattusasensis]|uniref:polysaccharide biosynthesis tyrosine autokinase n=1 Tax=Saccharopolyspora hattusasensis TaxID=1128679 RepID=UPI003D99D969
MSFRECLHVIAARWVLITVCALLGLAVAVGVIFGVEPKYKSETTLFMASRATDMQNAYQGSLLSEQKAKSYVALLGSQRLSEEVSRSVPVPMRPEEISEKITASVKQDTVLVTAIVTDSSPHRAQMLARAVGEQFVALVADLESPSIHEPPTVTAKIVQPATLRAQPVSPDPARYASYGLFLGLLVGVATAFLRNALDTSVVSTEQLTALTGLPNLGAVMYDAKAPSKPLIVHDHTHAPRAEAIRQIRTNLQYLDPDNPASLIALTSSLPAEGKTTTLCNLAIASAQAGANVAVVEADLRRPRCSNYLGIERSVGLTSVLVGRVPLTEALQSWGGLLSVLSSGPTPPNPSEMLASRHMKELLASLREKFDLVLIDTPPLLPVADAAVVAAHCDGALVVVQHGRTKQAQVKSALDSLSGVGVRVFGTVVNMAPATRASYYYRYAEDSPTRSAHRFWIGKNKQNRKASVPSS